MKKTFFLLYLLLSGNLSLAENSKQERREPLLLIEPACLHPPIADFIPGAKKTVIAAAWAEPQKTEATTRTSFLQPSWKTTRNGFMKEFTQQAREGLSKRLATLRPQFLRDDHGVIQVAIIDDPQLVTASLVLAPEFSQHFAPIFGPVFWIALPTRHKIYVFSKLLSPLAQIGATIRDDYQLSLSPLTLEVFELGHGEIHAVGSLE